MRQKSEKLKQREKLCIIKNAFHQQFSKIFVAIDLSKKIIKNFANHKILKFLRLNIICEAKIIKHHKKTKANTEAKEKQEQ